MKTMKTIPKPMVIIILLLVGSWYINFTRPSAQEIIKSERDWAEMSALAEEHVEGDFGTLYFSRLVTNGDAPTLYFVDEVVTTPFTRTWASGGGHNILNLQVQNVQEKQAYFFSAQFLGADGKMTKGLFGIIRDDAIKSIFTNSDNDSERIAAHIITLPDTSDRLYFMPLDASKVDADNLVYTGMVLTVNYTSEPSKQFFISPAIFESQGKDVAYINEQ